MRRRKETLVHFGICIGLLCVIWGGFVLVKKEMDKKIKVYEDDFSLVYQIDEVSEQAEQFVLEGFAFKLREDARKGAYEIVLQNVETKEFVFLKTKGVSRENVNAYFLCEYDYTNSGFIASIDSDKVLVEDNIYEILIRLKKSQKAYRTSVYIFDGNISYTKNEESLELQVSGTNLESVVNEGVLRLCLPEKGVYAYQYSGSMYYIMEEKYKQHEEYFSRIVTRLQTTQIDQLPLEKIETGTDEINTYFDDTKKEGAYYLCKVDLPKTYSITKMDVGNYHYGHWVWKETIRPYYEFD